MAIRIRKLAKEIGCASEDVIALLQANAQRAYTDPEMQLPASVEQLVRRHAKALADGAARGRPLAPPRPPRAPTGGIPVLRDGFEAGLAGGRTEAEARARDAEADARVMSAAMAGVRPIGQTAPKIPPGPKGRAADPARDELLALAAQRDEARKELERARRDLDAARAAAAAAVESARAAAAERDAARAELVGVQEQLAEVDAHRRSLAQKLTAATSGAARPRTVRAVLEERGLRGDDELAAALRALLDARRHVELLDALELQSPDALSELVWARLLLVEEPAEAPPGVVAVRVPAERSEAARGPNRVAMQRFSTACLVRGKRRVVFVGGSPAYRRVLKEGLDPRLEVKFVEGDRRGNIPDVPDADYVFVWASSILDHRVSDRFPRAVVLPSRGISRMLDEAVAWIERGDAPQARPT